MNACSVKIINITFTNMNKLIVPNEMFNQMLLFQKFEDRNYNIKIYYNYVWKLLNGVQILQGFDYHPHSIPLSTDWSEEKFNAILFKLKLCIWDISKFQTHIMVL